MCLSEMGLSAQAIASTGSVAHHPWDPADLHRCMNYCDSVGLTTDDLRKRMAGRSREWDRLLPHWDDLIALLRDEMATRTDGTAPRTYHAMRCAIEGGQSCAACSATGRGVDCTRCKGTGRRSSGRCRAPRCFGGADLCPTCTGRGFTTHKAA